MYAIDLVDTVALPAHTPFKPSVKKEKKRNIWIPYDPRRYSLADVPVEGTPYRFKLLDDPEELRFVFRRRFDVFCLEKGIADPINYPDMLETDEYDNRSFHVAILEEGNIIAYGRLVLPCERYPIEKTNVLPECFDRETTVETSRAFVVKERRHSDVMWHLFNGGYNFCRANGFKHMLSFSNAIMYNGYRKRHVPFDYVGEPVYFHGHKSYPLVIRVEEESYDFTQKQQFAFA